MTKTTEELKREMYKALMKLKLLASGPFLSTLKYPVEQFELTLEAHLESIRQELADLKAWNTKGHNASLQDQAELQNLRTERDELRKKLQAFEFANQSAGELLRDALSALKNRNVIALTPAEIQSQYNRVQWAEGLILQLPEDHEGRNSWLMNYGEGIEAKVFAGEWHRDNCEIKTERDCYKRSSEGREAQLAEALELIERQREFISTLYTSRKARKSKPATRIQSSEENASETKCGAESMVLREVSESIPTFPIVCKSEFDDRIRTTCSACKRVTEVLNDPPRTLREVLRRSPRHHSRDRTGLSHGQRLLQQSANRTRFQDVSCRFRGESRR